MGLESDGQWSGEWHKRHGPVAREMPNNRITLSAVFVCRWHSDARHIGRSVARHVNAETMRSNSPVTLLHQRHSSR